MKYLYTLSDKGSKILLNVLFIALLIPHVHEYINYRQLR